MQDNLKEALRLLYIYLGGRGGYFWALAGRPKASCRAHILSALHGRRVPQSKAGVNALERDLFEAAGIQGSCPAVREENFWAWAEKVRGETCRV